VLTHIDMILQDTSLLQPHTYLDFIYTISTSFISDQSDIGHSLLDTFLQGFDFPILIFKFIRLQPHKFYICVLRLQ